MDTKDLKNYRKMLKKEYSFETLKIESSLTYITAGALGFFMFLDGGSYLKFSAIHYQFLLPISLSFLFVAFVLILIRISYIIKNEFDMLMFVESMEPDSDAQEQELASIMDRTYINRTTIQTLSSIGLGLGIGLQVLFMILNIW